MELLATLAQDLRHGLRRLRQTPQSSLLILLMLGLALGSHLAVVGVVDSVLLQPLPVEQPERLVAIHETRDGDAFRSLAHADFLHYRSQSRAFSGLAAHYSTARLNVDWGAASEVLDGAIVSQSYFALLGVEPGSGRFFLPEEDATRGTHPVVVVSDSLWRRRFGGEAGVLGSSLKINGVNFTVVGVAPPGFVGLDVARPCDLWMPTMMAGIGSRWCDGLGDRRCRLFEMVGRLAAGETLESAQQEMSLLGRRLHAAQPLTDESDRGLGVTPLTGLDSERGRSSRTVVSLLLAVASLVVMVACANLAGVLLGRAVTRRGEIAVRLALGAGRRRIVSLFVFEALILSAGGGVVALFLASWAEPLATLVFETRAPVEITLGPTTLGYAAALCVLVGLTVGAVPGLRASRPDLVGALRDAMGQGPSRRRLLAAFVVAQIAVTAVLLHSTGVLGRSLDNLTGVSGVAPANIATLRLNPRLADLPPARGEATARAVLRELEALPAVLSVGVAKRRPLWSGFDRPVVLPGEEVADGAPSRTAGLQPVGPGTFESLGIPLLRGRDFDDRDVPGATPTLVVNATLAERLWRGGDAVGRRVRVGGKDYEVIGVVQDCPFRTLVHGRTAQAFSAFWQDLAQPDARFSIRFSGPAEPHLAALRKLVYSIDPEIPVTEVATLEDQLRHDLAGVYAAGRLTAFSGLLAVLLSCAGLASVLSLSVAQRRRELGIRKALGANRRQILATVVRRAMVWTAFALGCGLLATFALGPAIAPFLYGVGLHDFWALAATWVLVGVVALLAAWWPARRAADVDPIVSLRG